MSMDLFLVRHGETQWNVEGRFCGHCDPSLTARGRAQARALFDSIGGESFDRVVSSPSIRAVETARLAYGEPVVDVRLRELDFGDLEGLRWDEFSFDVRRGLGDYDNFQAPRGESVRELGERVLDALYDLGYGRHLVVTHGGVIRFLSGKASMSAYPGTATLVRLRTTVRRKSAGLVATCEVISNHSAIASRSPGDSSLRP
jgi:2,3-bisphosphoglycerate-dependent phosphoglycerate mutase